jgi:hypothetical protein
MKRVGLYLLLLASVSCGELTRQGTASSYLVITQLSTSDGEQLRSDVVTDNGTIFEDLATVSFRREMKDPAGPGPSPVNDITVNRYRVKFIRADGHNTEGVDVPYAFDGAFTLTVSGTASASFALVRAQAKAEAPLKALGTNPVVISTIAQITFYGHDQTGREVLVTGQMSVHFANWADE